MNLNEEKQARFDDLRQREFAGKLTVAEQHELEALTAMFTQAADESLLPVISRLQREQRELEERLQKRHLLEHEASRLRGQIARLSGLE